MARAVSIADARHNFARLVHDAERRGAVEVTRRGRTVAVLMSKREYDRLAGGGAGFWAALCRFRVDCDAEELTVGPEDFEHVRDRSPGREGPW